MSHTDDKHTALLSHSANDTQEPLPAKHHSLDYFNSSSNWAVYCNSCSQLAGFSQLYTLCLWNNIHVLSGTLKPYALSQSVRSQWIIIIIISGKQARKHQRWNVWKQNWFGFNVVSRFTPCVSATTWPYLLVDLQQHLKKFLAMRAWLQRIYSAGCRCPWLRPRQPAMQWIQPFDLK